MKRIFKMTLFTLVMFTILSVTSVKAATFKFELSDGIKKEIESSANTVGDLKKEIEDTIGIKKEYQVWKIGTFPMHDDMVFDDGEYDFYLDNENTDTITVHKRVELEDTIEIKSYYPNLIKDNEDSANEFIGVFDYIFSNQYYGYELDYSDGMPCNEDYTRCKLSNSSTSESYKTVNIKYVYDKKIAESIDKLTKKLGYSAKFSLKDFELINFWLNGGSSINYSDEYKKIVNYKNFYLDIRAGSEDTFVTDSFGVGYYSYNGTLYKVVNELGTEGFNILYVESNVENDKLLDTIQKRIDSYIGKGKMTVSVSDYSLDEYIEEARSSLNQYDRESDYYKDMMKRINELDDVSADRKLYKVKVDDKEYKFVIGKNTEKMYTPKLITSDFKTNVMISTDNTSVIPLDAMINIKKLTSGEEYNKILKILNITDNEMFDISLFTNSLNKNITKLDDGSFEVKIPITEKLKDKNLVVYYVDNNNKIETYDVEISDGYAVFKTNHFSIYTLSEVKEEEPSKDKPSVDKEEKKLVENPKTGDNIVIYIAVTIASLVTVVVCLIVYLKKKKSNK